MHIKLLPCDKKPERYGHIKESASFSRKLLLSLKISPPFLYYAMKTILPDAESYEEHDATKHSP